VLDHGGDVNIEDNEGDTPLFVAETVETARCLVEELGADINHQNDVGLTVRLLFFPPCIRRVGSVRKGRGRGLIGRRQSKALDMIEDDGNFLHVVAYLHERMSGGAGEENGVLPPASGNVHVSYTTMGVPDDMGVLVADERQQRIAEIAEFADLDSQEAQRALRELITGVVRDSDRVGEEPGSERNVRPRQGGQ